MPVGLVEGRPPPGTVCRLRSLRLFLLVVVVLMLGQFSFNMLFYRNYDSLFYVNTTSISPFFSLDSRLWWTSSNIRWLQSPPVKLVNDTQANATSPIKNLGEEDVGRGATEDLAVTGKGVKVGVRTSERPLVKHLNESDFEGTKGNGKQSPSHTALPLKYSTKPMIETIDKAPGRPSTVAANSVVLGSNSTKTMLNDSKPGASDNVTQAKPTPEKPLCPPVPPSLIGVVEVSKTSPTLEAQERTHQELDPGGHYRPESCTARHKVAIIIPYRDRVSHLAVFLYHMHPILQRQQLDYTIFVVEQAGNGKFNRAMLMNVGALEALKQYPFSCFVFHDVDLLPEDDRNLYTCPEQPRHMSIAIDTMKYRLPYNDIFGGVSAMTVKQFRTVNGFSNKFWGWGGEDDDMSNRIKHHHYHISRYPANVGRYTMLTHKKDSPNPRRYQYLHEGKKRYKTDGLNSVKYRTLDTQLRRLYTWIYVDLFPS